MRMNCEVGRNVCGGACLGIAVHWRVVEHAEQRLIRACACGFFPEKIVSHDDDGHLGGLRFDPHAVPPFLGCSVAGVDHSELWALSAENLEQTKVRTLRGGFTSFRGRFADPEIIFSFEYIAGGKTMFATEIAPCFIDLQDGSVLVKQRDLSRGGIKEGTENFCPAGDLFFVAIHLNPPFAAHHRE